jgi:hypothetical protein
MRPRPTCLCFALAITATAGPLAPTPARAEHADEAVARSAVGLLADVQRIVDIRETLGWYLDDEAYEAIRSTMLESVCQTTVRARERAMEILGDQVLAAGDAESLFEADGREVTPRVAHARAMQRRYQALSNAVNDASDKCPFWEVPDPDFEGRQTDRNRFILSLETGGLLQIRNTQGKWTYGGGGAARLLPGYGFGGDVSVMAGVEFGGGALLKPDTSPTELAINYFPALPVLVRFHDANVHYDVEVAPIGLFQADNFALSYGARIGVGGGYAALRTRGVIPWAGLALAYEHFVPSGGRERAHFFRGGIRVGLVWDP